MTRGYGTPDVAGEDTQQFLKRIGPEKVKVAVAHGICAACGMHLIRSVCPMCKTDYTDAEIDAEAIRSLTEDRTRDEHGELIERTD